MYYWLPGVAPSVWIGVFFVLPICFNLLNVRKVGEIEFTFTTIKVLTLVGLVIFGCVIIAGGVDGPFLSGLDSNYHPVTCDQNNGTIGTCISPRGFNCINSEIPADFRLERVCIQAGLWNSGSQRKDCRFLGLLWNCHVFLHRNRTTCHHSLGN